MPQWKLTIIMAALAFFAFLIPGFHLLFRHAVHLVEPEEGHFGALDGLVRDGGVHTPGDAALLQRALRVGQALRAEVAGVVVGEIGHLHGALREDGGVLGRALEREGLARTALRRGERALEVHDGQVVFREDGPHLLQEVRRSLALVVAVEHAVVAGIDPQRAVPHRADGDLDRLSGLGLGAARRRLVGEGGRRREGQQRRNDRRGDRPSGQHRRSLRSGSCVGVDPHHGVLPFSHICSPCLHRSAPRSRPTCAGTTTLDHLVSAASAPAVPTSGASMPAALARSPPAVSAAWVSAPAGLAA